MILVVSCCVDTTAFNNTQMMSRRLRPFRIKWCLVWSLLLVMHYAKASHNAAAPTANNNDSFMKDTMVGQIGATLIGESALIDKETGRVIWEGRSTSTLSESVNPYLSSRGLNHIKASLLTSILLVVLLSRVASWIREHFPSDADETWLPTTIALFAAKWTILRLPEFDTWFVVAAILLYLLEAFTCNTRRYLNNAISSPAGVEEYVESLRSQPPTVSWKVRSFHYEKKKWLMPLLYPIQLLQSNGRDSNAQTAIPPVFRKKVVSRVEQGNYEYTSYQDNTIAGVWKRSLDTSTLAAPFTKITLSKLIVLTNEKARQDYFKQQADFVTAKGQGDEFAEFATNIEVEGFKPRMLAVRAVKGVPSAKLFRIQVFWLSTLLGLTLPYRIWFSRHCDEVRVTVVKETSSEKRSSSWTKKGWFSRKIEENVSEEVFRQRMQDFALYHKADDNATVPDADTQILLDDMEAARLAANLTNANETLTEPLVTDLDDNEPNATAKRAKTPVKKTTKLRK